MGIRRLASIPLLLFLCWGCHRFEGTVVRVESGENLQSLSEKYNVKPDALLKANPRMKYYPVQQGEKILIPQRISRAYIPSSRSRYVPVTERYPAPAFPENGNPAVPSEEPRENPPSRGAPLVTAPIRSPSGRPPVSKKGIPASPPVAAVGKPVQRKSNAHDLRFLWPAKGKVISTYGKKDQKMHNGIDIRTSPGGDVRASEVGTVVFSGNELAGYGNLVILRHRPKIYSVYAYLSKIIVKKGDTVTQGQVIAKVGSSASDSFFHFEIRNGKQALDPMKHLP